MLVILLNCVTLGLFQPCEDIRCQSQWCAILQAFDDFIFAFFAVEMVIKMVALGIFGPKCYLGDTWNRLDFFIVMAGMLEYSLDGHNTSLSAIRTVRVLRPLRAINRVPSMRILVTLLLDTLPMLGNVLLLCFFVFFIFGIVGVQLWAGLLRNRCFLEDDFRRTHNLSFLSPYYKHEETEDTPFICSSVRDNGMLRCHNVPPLKEAGVECHLGVAPSNHTEEGPVATSAAGCINWNQYYNVCRPGELNPHKGAVSFDNIGYAWIAIFQVITLEGWVDIMYYVMDAHSFYNFIYFILLIIVGSFFMINLCLVVIATQFSETKQRENQLMQEQRARFLSNDSTLASFSEPGTCYEELLKYVGHLYRKLKRRALRVYGRWKTKRRKKVNPNSAGGEARRWRGRRSNGRHGRSVQHLVQHHQHQPYHHHYPLSNGSQGPRDTLETTDFWRPQNCLGDGMNYPIIVPSTLCSHTAATPRGKGKKTSGNTQGYSTPDLYTKHTFAREQGLHLPAGGTTPSWLQLETIGCPYCDRREPGNTDSDGSEGEAVLEFTRDPGRKWGGAHGGRRSAIRHWDKFQTKLRRIAESKYFNRGIMIAILVNTLSMGIEYHQQPDELTDILEISNVVFTSMFALEMVLKLLAFSIVGYIRNPYNIFDGIIVIISVWEILSQAEGGLSVLRTFRLLRVLKLVRFLPALRRQLVVLMKTMDNVATFCMLLMLFIFIFSILGMHLFGCKFSLRTENGDTIPDRKNFDSLLWAIVTVFQILTQEDWNVVLYNGMASTTPWAALYFVALMSFGNYVLFNLLVAILVEGFQAEGDANKSDASEDKLSVTCQEEEKQMEIHTSGDTAETRTCFLMMVANGHMEPSGCIPTPTIMRTAATPTPTPKGSLGAESTQGFDDSRRGSGASIDPHVCVQRSLSSHPSSPSAPRGAGSSWGSRRSSWNSLSRAPSLKRRDTSGERESLLSGDGRGSLDDSDGEGGVPGGTPPPQLQQHPVSLDPAACLSGKRLNCSSRTPQLPSCAEPGPQRPKEDPDVDEDADESCAFRLRKFLESFRPRWCIERAEWSLYAFSPHNQFRRACQRLISHRMFDHVVLLFIFLNCITIALERPDIPAHSTVVALGFCAGKGSYLRSSWNVLDGALVFVSIVDVLVLLASAGGNRILGILRVLRLLRTLRPLRVISRAPGLKLVVETLITSLRPIGNIVLICCAFFIVFGILGVQLFKGKFYHCEGADVRNISNKSECLQARYRWVQRKYNFDNLGQALMALFVLSSKDGWVNIMYDGLDAVGVDQQPVRNHNPWMLLYFISFLLIVSFFVLNMFVGVVVENFHKCRQDQEEEEARRREEKQMRRLNRRRRKAQQQPYYANYSPVRLYIHTLCTNHYLDIFITIIIAVNVVTMSLEHYNQPRYLEEALKYCNYFFTVVFVLEALLKFVAFGFRRFFKDRWNQLDLAIILLSILGIILEEIEISAALPMNPTIIRIMRVLRIARVLKLLKMATGMRALLDTVVQALPQVGNLGLLFMLLFFIYAALGVELFGKLECTDENPCEGLSRHATFENFGMAFLTLFRISTGDNWNGIMKDTLRECQSEKHCLSYLPYISPLYFVTFVLIAQFVLVNVVVAVLMKHLEESNKEAREDGELDVDTEAETTRRLSAASGTVELDSEGRATYVGPVPTSSRQDEESRFYPAEEGSLSLQKVSVSRMHSLPNDSYMFRPVRPTSAPQTLPEDDPGGQSHHLGSVTSVRSQPCVGSLLLQVPDAAPWDGSEEPPRIRPPPRPSSGGSRSLRRQGAVKRDSVETQSVERLERHRSLHLRVPVSESLVPPSPTPEGHGFARLRASSAVPFERRSLPCRPSRPNDLPPGLVDLEDEEVWHINSSARSLVGVGQPVTRSHSLSPCAAPDAKLPVPPKSGSAAHLPACGAKDKDLRKFYSVDAHGFLAKPSWAEDTRRHSIEICLPADDGQGATPRTPPPRRPAGPRKKKMSPPCVPTEPPVASLAVPPESSTLLRRRTPSCEAYPQDAAEPAPPADPLPVRRDQLSFDQSDLSSLSSTSEVLSDSEASAGSPSCGRGQNGGLPEPTETCSARSPLRKRGPVRAAGSGKEDRDNAQA
ncbi:voltage-dependent T-type calcium channel subunit alpha-1H-like isoform X2 [Scleropages formosus]|uniref:voltage-dependent T-type calcium channel subunit alpha-1H-like isoform X2 n=1 Tax=Scleropages formosus TaxID=113540 RepID=UPI0010FAC298|nr:voltage-dependent T-type calcium channel subunit alpha-1H-like isoform X2 [Scleropages formosus]